MTFPRRISCLVLGFAWLQSTAQLPNPPASDLKNTIQQADAKLFSAYNRCDMEVLAGMVADDLEFYHDQTGLTTGKEPFLKAIRTNICGKVHRDLLPETLEVYPLRNYGAVEIGVHRFTHPGHPEDGLGDARFVQLWQKRGEYWVLTRVISFEHVHGALGKQDCKP